MATKTVQTKKWLGIGVLMLASALGSFTYAQDKGNGTKDQKKSGSTKIRGAIDVGSSAMKFKIFEVDILNQKIVKQIFPTNDAEKDLAKIEVPLGQDLIDDRINAREAISSGKGRSAPIPSFSVDIQYRMNEAVQRFLAIAKDKKATDVIAVATQAFREAKNADLIAKAVFESNDIKFIVPSQKDEAMLEWMGVIADAKEKEGLDPVRVISWGIGSSSMQIGAKQKDGLFVASTSPLASDDMVAYAMSKLERKGYEDILPLSEEEISGLVDDAETEGKTLLTPEIQDKLKMAGKAIYGVGGVINTSVKKFLTKQMGFPKDIASFTKEDLGSALKKLNGVKINDSMLESAKFTGKDGRVTDFRVHTVTNMILVYGIMKGMRINEVYFSDIDLTYAAPFTPELTMKMAVRKIVKPSNPMTVVKSKPVDTTVAAKAGADDGKTPTASQVPRKKTLGEQLKEKVLTADAADETNSVAVDTESSKSRNQEICTLMGGKVNENRECRLNAAARFMNQCDGGKLSNGACVVSGNPKLIYLNGVK